MVAEAPCISVQVLMQHVSTSTSTADLILEPVELSFSSGTLSNILCLTSQLQFGETTCSASTTVAASEGSENKKALRFCASCPSVTVTLPLGLNSLEGFQDTTQYAAVFDRCGYMLPHAPVSRRSSLGITLDALSVLYESNTSASSEEHTVVAARSDSDFDTTVSCHHLLCFVTAPRVGVHGSIGCMQRADIIASSGHAPLRLTHRSNQSVGEETSGGVSFPVVPPLSSFKARQEDEDSDDENAFCDEFTSLAQNASPPARASDPQGVMLKEADQCNSVIDIYLPELVGDLTRDEATSLLHVFLAELSCIGERAGSAESRTSPSRKTCSQITSIAVSVDQVTLAAHQKIEDDTGLSSWYSHEILVEGFKAHTVVLDWSRLKTVRALAHELNFFEGKKGCVSYT